MSSQKRNISIGIDYYRGTSKRKPNDLIPPPNSVDDFLEWGLYGYSHQIRAGAIIVLFSDGKPSVRACLQCAGQAMAQVRKSMSDVQFLEWTRGKELRTTRFDIALDVNQAFPILDIKKAFDAKKLKSSAKTCSAIDTSGVGAGKTVYLGSRASERFLRVYDKAAQLGIDTPLTRFELVLGGKRAEAAVSAMVAASAPLSAVLATELKSIIRESNLKWLNEVIESVGQGGLDIIVPRNDNKPTLFVNRTIRPFLESKGHVVDITALHMLQLELNALIERIHSE